MTTPRLFFPGGITPGPYSGFNFGSGVPNAYGVQNQMYCNSGTGASADGREIVASADAALAHMCDVSTVGINTNWTDAPNWCTKILGGMDKPLPTTGNVPLYFYLVRNDAGFLALMASQDGYADFIPRIPSGWTNVRQMHFGCVYRNNGPRLWNGLPDGFTDIDSSAHFILSGAGPHWGYQICSQAAGNTAENPGIISLKDWVINDVRTVKLFVHAGSIRKIGAGTAYIGNFSQNGLWPIAETGPYNENVYVPEMLIKLDSESQFKWYTIGGATLTLYIKEWWFDDPT